MKLHEMDPDRILAELERRGDEYADAKARAASLENTHATIKAAVYNAIRKIGGVSVEDAKARALESEQVIAVANEWLEAEHVKDKAYLALERARTATDLWRSDAANRRRA